METISQNEQEVILASDRPKRSAGRKKFTETRHPVYRNIRRRKNHKWVCEVREPNKKSRLWLGTHETAEMAARAYDVAALALRGKSACLNFADSVWRLPRPESSDAKDIRKAAAEAAELFAPSSSANSTMGDDWIPSKGNGNLCFLDDDLDFEMASLLEDMAEGLLLPPPSYVGSGYDWGVEENSSEASLWSFSV